MCDRCEAEERFRHDEGHCPGAPECGYCLDEMEEETEWQKKKA